MKISKQTEEPVKGKPKSGRVWKSENKKFSNLLIQNSTRTNWEKKMAEKTEKKLVKKREEDIKNDKKKKAAVSTRKKSSI